MSDEIIWLDVIQKATNWPDCGKRVTRVAQRRPFLPGALEEAQVARRMHAFNLGKWEVGRRRYWPNVFCNHGLMHIIGMLRLFEARHEFSAEEFEFAAMGAMIGAVNNIHSGHVPGRLFVKAGIGMTRALCRRNNVDTMAPH